VLRRAKGGGVLEKTGSAGAFMCREGGQRRVKKRKLIYCPLGNRSPLERKRFSGKREVQKIRMLSRTIHPREKKEERKKEPHARNSKERMERGSN